MYLTLSLLICFCYSHGLKMGRSIIICSQCKYFKADSLDYSIGYCTLHRMESIQRARKNTMWCGPNATNFENIENFNF